MGAQSDCLADEELVALSEGRRTLPGAPSVRKLYYWWRYGVRSETGRRVFLETIKIGGTRYTSRQAFRRFISAISDDTRQMYEVE